MPAALRMKSVLLQSVCVTIILNAGSLLTSRKRRAPFRSRRAVACTSTSHMSSGGKLKRLISGCRPANGIVDNWQELAEKSRCCGHKHAQRTALTTSGGSFFSGSHMYNRHSICDFSLSLPQTRLNTGNHVYC